MKTYNVKIKRPFKKKIIKENIQVDAVSCKSAKNKAVVFFKKGSSKRPIKAISCTRAKRKKPNYLRI